MRGTIRGNLLSFIGLIAAMCSVSAYAATSTGFTPDTEFAGAAFTPLVDEMAVPEVFASARRSMNVSATAPAGQEAPLFSNTFAETSTTKLRIAGSRPGAKPSSYG